MRNLNIKLSIPCDSDGYVAFECPFCETEFKLLGSDFQKAEYTYDDLFCPYCGLTSKRDRFFTKDQVEHVEGLCENYIIEQVNNMFGKTAKSVNKSKYQKAKFTPNKPVEVNELREHDTAEEIEIFRCKHCEGHEKVFYSAGKSKVFCAYCGVDI